MSAFIIADSPEARERMRSGTQGSFIFNAAKVRDASHVILFCAKTGIDEAYQHHILEREAADGRFLGPTFKMEGALASSTYIATS